MHLFQGLDILTIKWAIGDLSEECQCLLNTQLMLLKMGKVPTTKLFDDGEWIRSVTEAQDITADVPAESVTYDQQAVDPKKGPAQTKERILAEKCVTTAPRTQRRRNSSPHDSNAAAGSGV